MCVETENFSARAGSGALLSFVNSRVCLQVNTEKRYYARSLERHW